MYMLDTNTVSYLIRKYPAVIYKIEQIPIHQLCISSISGAELWYGLLKKPDAIKLHKVIEEFLKRVNILPWDKTIMQAYGQLRATLHRAGTPLGEMDTLIAAHALATNSILVTNDAAFSRVKGLTQENWTLTH